MNGGLPAASAALAAALCMNFIAGSHADARGEAAPIVEDLVLGVLPHWNLDALYLYGPAAFLALLAWVIAFRERARAARYAWSYAALIAVRSVFVVLTPLHVPAAETTVVNDPVFQGFMGYFTFKHDLFFSLHTATPFLACLMARDRRAKAAFGLIAGLMAATVLLGRHHYSVDVLAAFFITYAVHQALERRRA